MDYKYCFLAGTNKGGCSRKEAFLVSKKMVGVQLWYNNGKSSHTLIVHYIVLFNDFMHSLDTYYLHVNLNSPIMNQTYL